jgi:2-polyprenyl-6-methoxyphenol hydroxylase-like FAD-dependent oxidoreductase
MSKSHTDIAIIGGGPVGLCAANLLGQLGIRTVLFEQNATTSFHPRGHVVNTRTMEIFRSCGLAEDVDAVALPLERHAGIGFVTSLAGDTIGVIETRGDPEWARIEASQSPVFKRSCPQDKLEPVLREHAQRRDSVALHFSHKVTGVTQDATGVTLTWENGEGATGATRAAYVIAADGPRSPTREAVGIGMDGKSIGQQIGLYFHADLWKYVVDRPYLLYWIFNAQTSGVLISLDGRYRWTYNFGYHTHESRDDFTKERCLNILRAVIGASDVEIDIKSIMPWRMQARIADTFSAGRVFIAGDAAHPLPPTGGQGMNTGIADIHNLIWKLNLVLDGAAPASLLATYTEERRPIASFNVAQSERNAMAMAKRGLSGMLANDSELLSSLEGAQGAANRAKLAEGIPEQREHFDYPGQTFGFSYESNLITSDGTPSPPFSVRSYTPAARPGNRAPHLPVTLDGKAASLLDLFSLDRFTLLHASDGQFWADAVTAADLPVPLRSFGIGDGGDVQTDTAAWLELYGLTRTGAVLIRPDGHVAWRSARAGDPAELIAACLTAAGTTAKAISPTTNLKGST